MKSIMCLNEKSITNIPIAIMTEANHYYGGTALEFRP